MKKIKKINEVTVSGDIPTDADIGPKLQPAGTFRGMPVFDCPNGVFTKCVKGKQKGAHWKRFLGDDTFSIGLKAWIKENPRSPFLFRNERTKTMIFARKGVI